jgi:hypothetical protein
MALLLELLQLCLQRLQLLLLARDLLLLVPQLPGNPPLPVSSQRSLLGKLVCQTAQDCGRVVIISAALQQLQPHFLAALQCRAGTNKTVTVSV